jgi:hypothetical protein
MSDTSSLASVLVHADLRNTTLLELKTPVGLLRLDLPGGPESVDPPSDPGRRAKAEGLLAQARQMMENEDLESADQTLLEAVQTDPLLPEVYRTWLGVAFAREDATRIEYAFKQLFALEQQPYDLYHFGKFLGRAGRLDESGIVLRYLWDLRATVSKEISQESAAAYLVTLHRQNQAARMIEVADEAVKLWGDQDVFLYQGLLGHVLLNHLDHVESKIPEVRARIPGDSPLHPRLDQMAEAVAKLKAQN